MPQDTKVKICGLTCREDADSVIRAGADFAGMVVFYPKSRRNLFIERAASLLKYFKEMSSDIKLVAVTVSPTYEQLEQIAEAGFEYIQIHGILDMQLFKSRYVSEGKLAIIRAYNSIDDNVMEEIEVLNKESSVAYYLFDAPEPGSGSEFDWGKIPHEKLCKPFFLAGGLSPDNVSEAVIQVAPFGVDVSSGVELDREDPEVTFPSPEEVEAGKSMKDRDKIIRFVETVKEVHI